MTHETGSGRNQVTHDHVFFEAAQEVDFAQVSGLGEDASRVLELRR
jgi:hypothetical protein